MTRWWVVALLGGCFGLNDRSASVDAPPGAPDAREPDAAQGVDASQMCAAALDSGAAHLCALVGGALQCWGEGASGQLGDAGVQDRPTPGPVIGLSGVGALGLGGVHSCALKEAGGLSCWGNNESGQLGAGAGTNTGTPGDVAAYPGGLLAFDGGYRYACVITTTGAVECWGDNAEGQLGRGALGGVGLPGPVMGTVTATAISTGSSHACVIDAGIGTVRCWGKNDHGQAGAAPSMPRTSAASVPGLIDIVALSTGQQHTCALAGDGTVSCWGDHTYDQLGPMGTGDSAVPLPVTGLTGVVALGGGYYHTCALDAAGGVKCWGYGLQGQLGNGTNSSSPTPVAVQGVPPIAQVAGGVYANCLRSVAGDVYCVGGNEHGQLGDGTFAPRVTPFRVPLSCP